METLINLVVLAILGVGIVGWLWITVAAFSDGETLWGIGCLIFFPCSLIYGFLNMQELKIPLIMVAISMVGRIGIGALVVAMGG